MMSTALLTGAAVALALTATTAARAETVYVVDMDAAAPGYIYAAEPEYVVQDRSYVVVAPPRERVIVAPRRQVVVPQREVVVPREVIIDQPAYAAPRDSFAYPSTTVPPGGYYTTGYTSTGSCVIDGNGFERCY
jgi:type IV secretory pathway protease TraF